MNNLVKWELSNRGEDFNIVFAQPGHVGDNHLHGNVPIEYGIC